MVCYANFHNDGYADCFADSDMDAYEHEHLDSYGDRVAHMDLDLYPCSHSYSRPDLVCFADGDRNGYLDDNAVSHPYRNRDGDL